MLTMELGPPRLETVQARLGQCLYLLSSSRANECWYTFGTAVQLVTAIGLHRRCAPKLSKKGISYLERELRKRILWSAYTLDKYLNVIFGRPRLLHDVDIDQELPDEVNDEDILQDDPALRLGTADSMMIASVLHFRFEPIVRLVLIGTADSIDSGAYWARSRVSFTQLILFSASHLSKPLYGLHRNLKNGKKPRRHCLTVSAQRVSSHPCAGKAKSFNSLTAML